MLISKKWLSEFVKLPSGVSDLDLAKTLTLSTVEVEKVIDQAAAMDKMVLGLVVACATHPNADRLKICSVDVGDRMIQVVCGGTNVAQGMKVAVALAGSKVKWHGEGDLIELSNTKIRGEKSEGMICAGIEIGIEKSGEGEHEIMDLSSVDAAPGTPLAKALGRDDVTFEIEHKSLTNRPDLMGHFGMAREVAALYRVALQPRVTAEAPTPSPAVGRDPANGSGNSPSGRGRDTVDLTVSIADPALCPRYRAVALDGIVVAPSPAWLRARLSSCGVRSINNVVDVTNFVMLELGQPMHAFDADKIGGDKIEIVVRGAKGEKVACLDDATYAVDEGALLITDGTNPIAIAGVMGGKESAVTNATTRIVFESANFSPVSVRKTSTRLALRSESSARFEKSLDPDQCTAALDRAVALLVELCPTARVASSVVDEYPNPPKPVVVELSPAQVSGLLGAEISSGDIVDILGRLGFSMTPFEPSTLSAFEPLSITIPSWRATKDVQIKEDVIEEVARIYGYDRIPSSLPTFSITPPPQDPVRLFARAMRKTLSVGLGATEVYRYAYVSPETIAKLGFVAADHVKLANPLAADRPYLAQSLLPNLFETVADNHRASSTVSVFEIDRVFFGVGEDQQPYHLAVAHSAVGDEKPFATVRENVRVLLSSAGLDVSFGPVTNPGSWMHPGRSADILVGGKKFGIVAESSPEASQSLGIDRRVAVAEMNLSMLAGVVATPRTFSPIPTFPSATRDLAFVVADRVAYADVETALRGEAKLLVSVDLFDVYRGKGVEDGKKSVAIHLSFAAADRTLSSEEVEREVSAIVAVLSERFDATMRA